MDTCRVGRGTARECNGKRGRCTVNLRCPSGRGTVFGLVVAWCLVLTVSVRCQRSERLVSYEDLCGVASEQFGTLDDAGTRRWIEEERAAGIVLLEPIQGYQSDSGSVTGYAWTEDDRAGAVFLRNARLLRISFREIERGPTLSAIVSALGAPQMVSRGAVMYGQHVVSVLHLHYLELGVSIQASRELSSQELSVPYEELAVTLRGDMRADQVDCYVAQPSPEAVLREVFFIPPENMQRNLETWAPWPGFGAELSLSPP
jgi:hypothetical protein